MERDSRRQTDIARQRGISRQTVYRWIQAGDLDEEPVVPFEPEPGEQGQVDFAHFGLPWGRRYALLVVLGYSRLLWLRFYPRQDMRTLIRGLEAAFRFFSGVPREMLFD